MPLTHMCIYLSISFKDSIRSELSLYEQKANFSELFGAVCCVTIAILLSEKSCRERTPLK